MRFILKDKDIRITLWHVLFPLYAKWNLSSFYHIMYKIGFLGISVRDTPEVQMLKQKQKYEEEKSKWYSKKDK